MELELANGRLVVGPGRPCFRALAAHDLELHAGRSRGVAKVVMRTPKDVAAAIERLNGEELGGRRLTLCHDRLEPREDAAAPPNPYATEDGPMDVD